MNVSEKGILALLFDFGFTDFITKKLIKFFYMAGMAVAGFTALSVIISGFSKGFGTGFLALIIAPVIALVIIAVVRMQLELVMVLFRIADYAREVAEARGSDHPSG